MKGIKFNYKTIILDYNLLYDWWTNSYINTDFIYFEVNWFLDRNIVYIQIAKNGKCVYCQRKDSWSFLTHLVYKVVFGKCYVSVIMGISWGTYGEVCSVLARAILRCDSKHQH